MIIYMDDSVLEGSAFETQDRETLLVAIRKSAADRGRVVTAFSLDGETITEETFAASSRGTELRVTPDSIRTLVSDSLQEASRYLPALMSGIGRIADLLEREKIREAADMFRQASEGIDWMLHVLAHCQKLLGLNDPEILDGKINDVRESLAASLKCVAGSLENGKYFELSFRLRNELIPELEKLAPYLHSLGASAEGRVQ